MSGTLKERFFASPSLPDCPIYDLHGHMGPLCGARLPYCSQDDMLRQMDRAGVRRVVFCHHAALFGADIGNRVNVEAVRKHPDRFKAYCGVNGNYPDVIKRDLETFDDHSDVYVGFKFLADYHKVPVTDERCRSVWELAQARRLLVLLHTWGGSAFNGPDHVETAAKTYPDVRILMGHSCHGDWERATRLSKEYPNVYLELTAVLDECGVVEMFVKKAGADKIIFGTDTPWFNHHYYLGALLGADITDEDRRSILYRNALRILAPFLPETETASAP